MNYYTQKCLEQFSQKRRKIIISVAKMTRQTLESSISDAWILNHIESDAEFKKQLNNQLQKNFLGDIKCGATCDFMSRFDGGEEQAVDHHSSPLDFIKSKTVNAFTVSAGHHHSSPLDVLIGLEAGLAGLGMVVDFDTKAMATDLGITQRHALREKKRQLAIEKVQAGLFDGGEA